MYRHLLSVLMGVLGLMKLANAQEEGRCGTVDTSFSLGPLSRIEPLINVTQDLVIVLVDFPDGRDSVTGLPPTDTLGLSRVRNLDAVGSFGWSRDPQDTTRLIKHVRKYTYEDYWDWIFSVGEYYGQRHPDSASHGVKAYGSMKEYYTEVSYGNLRVNPYQTWNRGMEEPNKYNTGIVNRIDTANGKSYVQWIMMPYPKANYGPNGPLGEIIGVLDSAYRNGTIQFNLTEFLASGGKIMIVAAGGGAGGVADAVGRQLLSVREKRYRNDENRVTFDGIWVSVHEFGHTLGFKHMCHSTYDPMNFTFRNSWNQHLYCPPHFNPLYKWASGWVPDSTVARVRTNSALSLAPVHILPDDGNCTLRNRYSRRSFDDSNHLT